MGFTLGPVRGMFDIPYDGNNDEFNYNTWSFGTHDVDDIIYGVDCGVVYSGR